MTKRFIGALTESEERQIYDAIEKWLERDVRPQVLKLEHADEYPKDFADQMAELGLFGATISPDYGGLGMSASTYAKVVSQIAEVWMSITGIFNSHLTMATILERNGSEQQKKEWLPKFATGEKRGALALTEPDAGTDIQNIKTAAIWNDNQYIVNGSKIWISNGIHCDVVALVAKTDLDADPPRKGMSVFLAEKDHGFRVARKLEKLGYNGIDTAELVFENYKLPAENLIGEEGQGFYAVLNALELGRINIAARGVGIAQAALKDSVRYAQERKTFGKPIAQHQAIQLKLADMATRLEAAKLLTEQAAKAFDRGDRSDMEAGIAKLFSSETALQNATEALRIHGGYGYSKELHVERYFRDAPLLCIGEGTNEMQRIIIARQLIERNKI